MNRRPLDPVLLDSLAAALGAESQLGAGARSQALVGRVIDDLTQESVGEVFEDVDHCQPLP